MPCQVAPLSPLATRGKPRLEAPGNWPWHDRSVEFTIPIVRAGPVALGRGPIQEELPLSTRVHELAKELGLKSPDLLDRIQKWGLDVKVSALASLDPVDGGPDQAVDAGPGIDAARAADQPPGSAGPEARSSRAPALRRRPAIRSTAPTAPRPGPAPSAPPVPSAPRRACRDTRPGIGLGSPAPPVSPPSRQDAPTAPPSAAMPPPTSERPAAPRRPSDPRPPWRVTAG